MKTSIKLSIYDIKEGFVHNGFRNLIPVVVGILGPILFLSMYKMVYGSSSGATILECAVYMFKGGKYLTPDQIQQGYVLPAYWLGIQIVIGFLVGYYPVSDLYTYGQQVLIRSKKRVNWWIAKCSWNVTTVLYCYAVIYLMMIITCAISGVSFSMTYSDDVLCGGVFEMYPCTGSTTQVIIVTFVMPVLVSIAVSLLQMTLSIIASPMIAFIFVEVMALMATMVVSPVFIHNFGALAHTSMASPSKINYTTGCIVCPIVAVVSVIAGVLYFGRYNILSRGE